MPILTTLEACCARSGVLASRSLLSRAQVRLMPTSRTSRCTLGWSIARMTAAAPLALGDSLPLHLAKLNMFVFKCYGLVQKLLERWEGVRHQLVLE
jgi:hypothetical protein